MATSNKDENKIECKCELHTGRKLLSKANFYKSTSPLLGLEYIPICKKCIKKMIDYDDINTIYKVLQFMDLPYDYRLWDKIKSNENIKNTFGDYIRQLSSLPQWKGKRWEDSSFDSSKFIYDNKIENNLNTTNNDNEIENNKNKLIYSKEWRGNYTQDDLDYLNGYYSDLQSDFKIVTRNHKDYAKKIAKASFAMDKAYELMIEGVQGADTKYKNLKDTFDQLSKSAQFAEDKRGSNEIGLGCLGKIIDKVERHNWIYKHCPIEKDDYDKMIEAFGVINKSL